MISSVWGKKISMEKFVYSHLLPNIIEMNIKDCMYTTRCIYNCSIKYILNAQSLVKIIANSCQITCRQFCSILFYFTQNNKMKYHTFIRIISAHLPRYTPRGQMEIYEKRCIRQQPPCLIINRLIQIHCKFY